MSDWFLAIAHWQSRNGFWHEFIEREGGNALTSFLQYSAESLDKKVVLLPM